MSVRRTVLIGLIATLIVAGAVPARAQDSLVTIGLHVTLVNKWFDPGETEGLITP